MEPVISEIAGRIRELREILEFSPAEMARAADVTEEEYRTLEEGKTDFSFTFLYKAAEKLGVDIVELLTGENPRLTGHAVTRRGQGLPIRRREGFEYLHLAARFKNKTAEPFIVTAPYRPGNETAGLALSRHEGQEFDYILEGSLRVEVDGHEEVLGEGDSIYYDSGKGHGMAAVGGRGCRFLAVVLKAPGA